ncbi:MAG: RNA methyltransferase, partial [Bacteroidota bacterium]
DPGNLGSIVRCCDWFGVDALLLSQGCVELHNEKVVRSSTGSLFHVQVVEDVDCSDVLHQLKKQSFAIIATAGDAPSEYTKIDPARKICLIFGSEAHGVSKEVHKTADLIVKIPKFGQAESLNVGVTCGIILAHLRMRSVIRH